MWALFRGTIKILGQCGDGEEHNFGKNFAPAFIHGNVDIGPIGLRQQVGLQTPDFIEVLQVMFGTTIRYVGAAFSDSFL